MTPPAPWLTVETIVRCAFETHRVVMINEAHNGLRRCPRTRIVGKALLPVARTMGCDVLAMEALANPSPGPTLLDGPPDPFGYLAQPEMAELIETAVALGFRLVAYECVATDQPKDLDLRSPEASAWRWQQQANHLAAAAERFATAKMLVWAGCGNHKKTGGVMTPMGARYAELDAPPAFAIDQTCSVPMHEGHTPMVVVDDALADLLDAHSGTLGFLPGNVPALIRRTAPGYDAFIVSTDNDMVDHEPSEMREIPGS